MASPIPIISWFDRNTVKHLRFPFSFFLLPVFLFALSQAPEINWPTTMLGFVLLHFFIFPSSNGYNSYQDRDESSIGGLKHPPKVSVKLYYATWLFDITAAVSSLFVSVTFSLFIIVFITMSRLYSYRGIRLKKYPFIAFIIVFIFQGGFVFLMASESIMPHSFREFFTEDNFICMMISSLFIGSMYPLTQIYQHESDKKDGVTSISYKLGYTGTFVFSGMLFALAVILFFVFLQRKNQLNVLPVFLLLILPVMIHLGKWFGRVRKDHRNADYENTMTANILSSSAMNLFFFILIINNQFTYI
jgi:1,4-dihydroxy-2-naphthoate polyprenyltransferase